MTFFTLAFGSAFRSTGSVWAWMALRMVYSVLLSSVSFAVPSNSKIRYYWFAPIDGSGVTLIFVPV